MKPSSLELKKLPIFQEGTFRAQKIKKTHCEMENRNF